MKDTLGDLTSLAETLNVSLSAARLRSNNTGIGPSIRQTMNQLLGKLKDATRSTNDGTGAETTDNPLDTKLTSASTTVKRNAVSRHPAVRQNSNPQLFPNSSIVHALVSSVVESDSSGQALSVPISASNTFRQDPNLNSSSGRLSPRLNYGLWFEPDPGLPIVVPPEDIVPFLDHAKSPFVVKLYWRTLMVALFVLRSQWGRRGKRSPETAILMQRIFGTSLQYDSGEVIAATIHARLGFHLRGRIEPTHPGRDPTNALRLYNMVQADLSMKGETMQDWLDAHQVEDLVGELFGLGQVMLLRAASIATADTATMQKTRRLVEGLARHSVCFGDCPRYPLNAVITMLQLVFDQRPEVAVEVDSLY